MKGDQFFEESKAQSVVKTALVENYFKAWTGIMLNNLKNLGKDRIAYVDLFCGPGRYNDGTVSTPIKVLEQAVRDDRLSNHLVTLFNDKDSSYCESLKGEIEKIPNISRLRYKPKIYNKEVGDQIARLFQETHLVPTLFFIDPWGYKGLSLTLVQGLLKDWGSDGIFFFNYNRVNPALSNLSVKPRMDALFGEERAARLFKTLEPLGPLDRELTIVEELTESLGEIGARFVLPFRFKNRDGKRTTHYLIFLSKHFKGYEKMKETMARQSQKQQGVASFEYIPATEQYQMLFQFSRPLDDLGDMLLQCCAGKSLTMKEIYILHNEGTPYVEKNYKDILKRLEADGKIVANPPYSQRRKNTFGPEVIVTFPPQPGLEP